MTFLMGAIVGAGVALLMAPATGTETRRRLGETAHKINDQARGKFGELRQNLGSKVEGLKHDVQSAVETGREAIDRARTEHDALSNTRNI